ncbi:DUF4422 domain-containing protein [Ruegeria sp. 2012CJ41-6]|uniref:DUF4422 domain-containing protein n=1 Tax=Ruegeria spongiae TaxID=2942209 RepID=A0ABT0Q9P8_9RHOB|nr:DUF4422 domain-containing protein [Ruegeria spongiae]MCL6285619.1 DUF4422 domain-containing protein [Ruegeria spongiae]
MSPALYVVYHKSAPRLQSTSVLPVQAGKVLDRASIPGMRGDDTGVNISEKNDTWCELTVLYWAWKNASASDLTGLMHYRRLLDFSDRDLLGSVEKYPDEFDTRAWCLEAEEWMKQEGTHWDIVVPRLHRMGRTVEENYRTGHNSQDWDAMCDIVRRDHPEYIPDLEAVASGYEVRLGNLVLMAKPVFDRYCSWLFDILFKIEEAPIDREAYSPYQARYPGFLSERLLTVFVHHENRTNPSLRLKEVSILNLSRSAVSPYMSAADRQERDAINIACSTDRAYLPHAAAMLRSVLDHTDSSRPLNFFFLHSNIDDEDLLHLQAMMEEKPGNGFHPINANGIFDGCYRSASRAPSNATYNRFLLLTLFPGLDRLLYLDADLIVKTDIGKLYDSDLGSAEIAAVPDWIMARTLAGPTRTIDPEVPDLAIYQRETLGLSEAEIGRYFNAGVLLFNFAAMKDPEAIGRTLREMAGERQFLFRDQDILNVHFKNSVCLLDARWNVFTAPVQAYVRVPRNNHEKAMAARRDPWIIHYADREFKPWVGYAVPEAQHYWQALIRTPFYGEVVRNLAGKSGRRKRALGAQLIGIGRKIAERIPFLKTPMLRLYHACSGGRFLTFGKR